MRRSPSRRSVLKGAGALGVVACNGPDSPDGADDTDTPVDTDTSTPPFDRFVGHPIIYIFVDQLRWDAIGAAGNPVAPTPNIDLIAAEGVRFSACITNGPSCRPARACMMTGQYVHQHGVRDNHCEPNPYALQSHVRRIHDESAYYTAVIGKTHLTEAPGGPDDHFDDILPRLQAWGFDHGVELPDPQMTFILSAHSDYLGEEKYALWQNFVNTYEWTSPAPDTAPWFLATSDHLDNFCGRTAADFIRAYAEDKPLYLQVNFPGPHKPFDPTTEYKELVDPYDPEMPEPILEELTQPVAPLTAFWITQEDKLEDWQEGDAWRFLRRDYYGKVALVDAGIGEVIAALKDTGLWDDAWIILHSDHGELLADHMLTGKVIPYDGAIRVPLIVRPPGGVTAWVDNGQVDQLDVTATLLAITGLDPTGFGERPLLDRVLGGPSGPEAHQTKIVMFENLTEVGLRTETHKLRYDIGVQAPVELYDLVADPDEVVNVVADPAYAEVLATLLAELEARRVTLGPPTCVEDTTK